MGTITTSDPNPGDIVDANQITNNNVAIKTVVNGGIDNSNIAASAGILDSKLASPNNAAYKTLAQFQFFVVAGSINQTFVFAKDRMVALGNVAEEAFSLFYFDPADFAVAGLTGKLRTFVSLYSNGVTPNTTFTFGLYPIGTVGGGSGQLQVTTLGTVITGSTVAFTSATIGTGTKFHANSGDFNMPTASDYAPAVKLTAAGQAANNCVTGTIMFQTRHV